MFEIRLFFYSFNVVTCFCIYADKFAFFNKQRNVYNGPTVCGSSLRDG